MKILKMRLENFQGVKELEIDPQGESSAIYGDNGTGKSTVYNAFTWLMYGKPSTTEKNYTPKTTGSHNLHHSVEMTVELADGSEMVLKKDYHEVYKTIKGNPQPVLSGHTTDYSMDGVPVSETQFKKNLLEIYHDEELAKMLTSYNYFLENMKVADRRKILLQVCGDADFNEVIESQGDLLRELPEMLRNPSASLSTHSSGSTVSVSIAGHANGGEVGLHGAELSWLGEEGKEYVIPTVPGRRGRGIALWQQAGEDLGVLDSNGEIAAHANGGIVGPGGEELASNTILPLQAQPQDESKSVWSVTGQEMSGDSSEEESEGKKAVSVNAAVQGQQGNNTFEINVDMSPVIKIEGGNMDEEKVFEVMKNRIREMADDLGDEIAERMSKIFANMPLVQEA